MHDDATVDRIRFFKERAFEWLELRRDPHDTLNATLIDMAGDANTRKRGETLAILAFDERISGRLATAADVRRFIEGIAE